MKDAKGHGSDSKNGGKFDETYGLKGGTPIGAPARPGATFPAHQQGVADAGRAAQFQAARQKQDQLEAESTRTGKALDSFPKGPMNLTPDSVRATPEWRAAKSAADRAFQAYRNFNGMMLKAFPNELKAERNARRGR